MTLRPIGVIHSPFSRAEGTPVQPRAATGSVGRVELDPAFAEGLKDLEGFERIWLIYWFDRASLDRRKLTVIPYLDHASHGVFATRAPARPNPIGMSAVRLLEIRQNVLVVSGLDILDRTPLLDIKPYVPQFDCYQVGRCGWMEDKELGEKVADGRFETRPGKLRVLILCTGNSARSQMAEGWLRHLAGDRFDVFSAGTRPAGLNPNAVKVMSEIGIDVSGQRSKSVEEFVGQRFDCVFTVCDHAKEACPVFPGGGRRIHHSFEDPAAAPAGEQLAVFRKVRDQIRVRLEDFVRDET